MLIKISSVLKIAINGLILTNNIGRSYMREDNQLKYVCELCNFSCTKASNFKMHLNTAKHCKNNELKLQQASHVEPQPSSTPVVAGSNLLQSKPTKRQYKCDCGRTFSARNGLWYHKKKCKFKNETIEQDNNIMGIVQKQQKQLETLITKSSEPVSVVNNNYLNINFFLNTQCKDAIPIQNFIQNLQIGVKELEHIGNVGYIDGIRSILNNSLSCMDLYRRPMHCTDLKREILYIKQGDTWQKDSDEKTALRQIIKAVEDKNYENVTQWERDHPTALECDTEENKAYLKIITETLGGDDDESNEATKTRLVKSVLKDVYVPR